MSNEANRNDKKSQGDMKGNSSPNMFEGKLVKMEGQRIVMTNLEGKEYSHTLANDAKLTCDGQVCKSNDLHAGSRIRVTTKSDDRNVATCVEALEKEGKFATCN